MLGHGQAASATRTAAPMGGSRVATWVTPNGAAFVRMIGAATTAGEIVRG
jgi:hypothetical protein